MRKIIAYYLNDKEYLFITKLLINQKITPSYIIGELYEGDEDKLKEEDILFKDVSKEKKEFRSGFEKLNTRIETRDVSLPIISRLENFINSIIITDEVPKYLDNIEPLYFTIKFDGPLLPEYANKIESIGVKLQQYIGENTYISKLDTEKRSELNNLEFIESVEYYNASKTPIKLNLRTNGDRIITTSQYDVILHSKEDTNQLINEFEKLNIQIIGRSEFKIRIFIGTNYQLLIAIANNKLVESIEEYIPPRLLNDQAREILNVDNVDNSSEEFEYQGEGILVGVADTGIDDTHPDLKNQIAGKVSLGRITITDDPNGHGTHVTGSIVGNGNASSGKIKGIAPKAKVFFQSLLNNNGGLNIPVDLKDLFQQAYDNNVRIHNNSWGAATKSRYTGSSNEVDAFVYNNKDMLIVFSAGNDGRGPSYVNVPSGYTDLYSLGSPATAKNAITVGASRSKRTKGGYSKLTYGRVWPQYFPDDPTKSERISGNKDAMAAFSSRGPTDESLRIKPDLVAPGTDIASAFSSLADLSDFCGIHPDYDHYALLCGTSMSAPIVAGCAALVREFYQKRMGHNPSAALVKATLINSCDKLTGKDCTLNNAKVPHFHQGFGLVNMQNCIPNHRNNFQLLYRDVYGKPDMYIKNSGENKSFKITLSTSGWIRICLVYTDPPGRGLQHNLILFAYHSATNKKWTGNDFIPKILTPPGGNIDMNNNVQEIHIKDAAQGEYTIQVTGQNVWLSPQDYALIVTTNDTTTSLNP